MNIEQFVNTYRAVPSKRLKYIKRICDDCPCCNFDYEEGRTCNLGYNTRLIWVHKTDQTQEIIDDKDMRSHQQDFDLINASDDCQLVKIETTEKTITPTDVNK